MAAVSFRWASPHDPSGDLCRMDVSPAMTAPPEVRFSAMESYWIYPLTGAWVIARSWKASGRQLIVHPGFDMHSCIALHAHPVFRRAGAHAGQTVEAADAAVSVSGRGKCAMFPSFHPRTGRPATGVWSPQPPDALPLPDIVTRCWDEPRSRRLQNHSPPLTSRLNNPVVH
jgi:hypothetical protein